MILFGGGLKQQNNDIACIEKENENTYETICGFDFILLSTINNGGQNKTIAKAIMDIQDRIEYYINPSTKRGLPTSF